MKTILLLLLTSVTAFGQINFLPRVAVTNSLGSGGGGGGGGGGAAETNIAGIYAFWEDSGISVGDGNAVTTWPDVWRSKDASQSTGGKKPIFRATGGPSSKTAVEFDGTDDYMVTPSLVLSSSTKFAVTFWLYWNAYGTDNKLVFDTGTVQYNNDGSFRVNPNSSDFSEFEFDYAKDVGRNRVTTARPPAATWIHYTINFDAAGDGSSGEIKAVWTNAVPATLNNCCGFDNSGNPRDAVLNFMSQAGTAQFGAGKLHRVAIYTNTALTVTDATNCFLNP